VLQRVVVVNTIDVHHQQDGIKMNLPPLKRRLTGTNNSYSYCSTLIIAANCFITEIECRWVIFNNKKLGF
jgi:hypothetical protein